MRVLPNKTKLNRPAERVRKGPHARSSLIWQVLLVSLCLDPAISLVFKPTLNPDTTIAIATLCAITILPFLAQNKVHKALSALRNLHAQSLQGGVKTLPLILSVCAASVIALKLVMLAHLPKSILAILLVVVVIGAKRLLSQIRKQGEDDKALFEANPWAQVQRWEQQLIVFTILPLLIARAIGILGALTNFGSDHYSMRFGLIIISGLFLGMLKPDRSKFIGTCKQCHRPVPIVFHDIGSCPSCNINLAQAYHAWSTRQQLPSSSNVNSQESDRTN